MYILSQDGKNLFNSECILKIYITRNIGGGKEGKFAVSADTALLGAYPEEADAINVLNAICSAIETNVKIFKVPQKVAIL